MRNKDATEERRGCLFGTQLTVIKPNHQSERWIITVLQTSPVRLQSLFAPNL